MKKMGTYWKVYIAIVLLLVLGGIIMCVYTKNSLETYEKCQPEGIVKEEMVKLQDAVKNNTLNTLFDLSNYDEDVIKQYYELMAGAKAWKCKAISGGYSDTAQSWGIYADDQLVAKVNLSGKNTRTMLLILTASDWTVAGVVNGLDLMPTPTPGPTEAPIIITRYQYVLSLPSVYTVICEDKVVEGTADGSNVNYDFTTTQETIQIKDEYGSVVDYKHGDTLSGHNIVVKIPEVFTIALNDVDISKYELPEKEDIKALSVCYEFADNLPRLAIYQFNDALVHPAFVITDQNGKNYEYEYEGDSLIISNLAKEDTVPAEITDVTNIMDIAEKWSLLMTRDLGTSGEEYGYNKITKYIIKDSPLLAIAKNYIRSDIWTISNHVLKDPTFTDESMDGYVRYSEDVFSIDVYLTKGMLVRNCTETRYDAISDTIFFIRNTGSGEPWLMVDMMSKK